MKSSIISRIEALALQIEQKKLENEGPMDPLSVSLCEFYREMAMLDEEGIIALHEKMVDDNGNRMGTLEQTRKSVEMWAKEYEEARKDGVYRRLEWERDHH